MTDGGAEEGACQNKIDAPNMVFMQWWLKYMVPTSDFQISFIPLTKTDGTGNATTA